MYCMMLPRSPLAAGLANQAQARKYHEARDEAQDKGLFDAQLADFERAVKGMDDTNINTLREEDAEFNTMYKLLMGMHTACAGGF